VTLTCDIWPWIFAAYRLWPFGTEFHHVTVRRGKTLYQIWTQSSNPWRNCDFSVWPYDFEHCVSVALGFGIIFTKFDLRQLIRAWIYSVFLMLIRYATLWPWPLTRWPRKFGYIKRHVIKVCTKFERNRAIPIWIIDNLANFCTLYVTLWPWLLTSWPWTFIALPVSKLQSEIE